MEITISQEQVRVPVTVFHIRGEITVNSYEQLLQQGREAIEAGTRYLLLDLTHVRFMSSSGLRAINGIFDRLRADSPQDSDKAMLSAVRAGTYCSPYLKLLNPSPDVLNTITMTGYDMVLEIHTDLQEALNSF